VSKDVRIQGYFSELNRACKKKKFGKHCPKMKHKQWKEIIVCAIEN
jgi:hypothetical protein